jgi:hypothetical protein
MGQVKQRLASPPHGWTLERSNSNQVEFTPMELNKLIKFRQDIYDNALTKARDAQFELVDALLSNCRINSFPELSLASVHQRQWSSSYAAVENGQQDETWLRAYLCEQVPELDVTVFALDSTVWCHPRARTLEGLRYEYSPTHSIKTSIVQGHPYSMLAWVPEAGRSWALPVHNARIATHLDSIEMGVQQVQWLCAQRASCAGLDVIVGDGRYGNHRFFGGLQQANCAVLVRLRRDRILYGPAPAYAGRGRPAIHGPAFAFKDPATWFEPVAMVELEDAHWGQVRLRRWDDLHAKQDAQTVFSVLCCEVHLERETPPKALWLGYRAAFTQDLELETLWRCFPLRWPIEPAFKFRKQRLHWTLPQLQQTARCDRWTGLLDIAYWMLYLGRELVEDCRLPWQKPLKLLTPGRVLQNFKWLFPQIGTPTCAVKKRGKSPGWQTGRNRSPPPRFKTVKRGKKLTSKS